MHRSVVGRSKGPRGAGNPKRCPRPEGFLPSHQNRRQLNQSPTVFILKMDSLTMDKVAENTSELPSLLALTLLSSSAIRLWNKWRKCNSEESNKFTESPSRFYRYCREKWPVGVAGKICFTAEKPGGKQQQKTIGQQIGRLQRRQLIATQSVNFAVRKRWGTEIVPISKQMDVDLPTRKSKRPSTKLTENRIVNYF